MRCRVTDRSVSTQAAVAAAHRRSGGGAMTLSVRAAHYHRTFPQFHTGLLADDRWLSGIWILGNDYRSTSGFYGSYPPNYLKRVRALFPDYAPRWRVLHLFAGSVPAVNPLPGIRVDLNFRASTGHSRRRTPPAAYRWRV